MSDNSNSSELLKRCDVFPKDPSERVDLLPEIMDYQALSCKANIFSFIPYLNISFITEKLQLPKIYFDQCLYTVKLQRHFINLTNRMKDSNPNIRLHNWLNIHKRIINANTRTFKNTDQRTCFLIEKNHFVVPQGFTFGVRTVEKGTGHLYITHNIPLYFFQLKSLYRKGFQSKARVFNPPHQCYFYRRQLNTHSHYLVPENTTYVITTLENTFFAVHIVSNVIHSDVTLKNPLHEPEFLPDQIRPAGIETPNAHDERFERFAPTDPVLLAFQSGQKVRISDLSSPAPSPRPAVTLENCPPPLPVVAENGPPSPLPVVAEDSPPSPLPVVAENSPPSPQPVDTENGPPSPVPENCSPLPVQMKQFSFERVVQVMTPNVVSWYAAACRQKTFDDPRPIHHYGTSEQTEPMDLSNTFADLETIVSKQTSNYEQYQELLSELDVMDDTESEEIPLVTLD